MRSGQTLPSPVVMETRTESTNAWIATCHALASSPALRVIGKNRVTVHSTTTGQFLFSLDWNREMIVVAIAQGARTYMFHDLKGALTFLSGVLSNRALDRIDPRLVALPCPARGGL